METHEKLLRRARTVICELEQMSLTQELSIAVFAQDRIRVGIRYQCLCPVKISQR